MPTDPSELAVVEALRHLGLGALPDHMGIELLEVGADRTVARMPVAGNTQPYGLLHGGASAVLAESVGSIASALHAGPDRIALGLELNCTHHKAMREGYVIGRPRRWCAGARWRRTPSASPTRPGRRCAPPA